MDDIYFQRLLYDIRNMKQLTTDQKINISSLSDEQKNQIILTYDEMIKFSVQVLHQSFFNESNYYK